MYHLQLSNEEDTPTYNYRNGTGTSVLDHSYATTTSTKLITSWAMDDEATSRSDYKVICFKFSTSRIADTATNSIYQQFNFKMADWTQFHNTLLNLTPNALLQIQQQLFPISDTGLEQASIILCNTLLLATTQSIPPLRPSPRSKPWWNKDLTTH